MIAVHECSYVDVTLAMVYSLAWFMPIELQYTSMENVCTSALLPRLPNDQQVALTMRVIVSQ